ncbi:hypothetical protein [Dyadobacter fanqingshengii]|uniref:Uncharacterized protein n=1 Tax=Dyadobacter fanqingshengii TaxID=2906443 RepID=A0A9X1PBX3_9BACT|nr:hypothetical protein [Dyadobacter fanqingshengii]MCF0040437.1 hypothetical protein [Dyadobacter fanqingshengii]MCF2501962.1 hypothetical protein [Dyadobacter fanqingshengii]USJ37821.1 hypothetical protein NFI81_08545 [Dyadobacter fanqingshengii]
MTFTKTCLNIVFALIAWLLWTPCLGQKKYEREHSIKPDAVPQKAMEFVNSVFKKPKIHWYLEESLTGKTIEAKLKSSGKRFSIEFDEAGNIQDVEILSSISKMNANGRTKLEDTLSKAFSRYKVVKTQIHWNGSAQTLQESLNKDRAVNGVLIRYELIVRGYRDKIENYFEVLAESDGTIVRINEIVQRNTDNLIY